MIEDRLPELRADGQTRDRTLSVNILVRPEDGTRIRLA